MISRFIKVYDGRRSDFAPISPKIHVKISKKIEIWVIQPQIGVTYTHMIPVDTFQQKNPRVPYIGSDLQRVPLRFCSDFTRNPS